MVLSELSAVVQVSRIAGSVYFEIRRVVEEDRNLQEKIKNGLISLATQVQLVASIVGANRNIYLGPVQETRLSQMQEVLYDIEDFLQFPRMSGSVRRKMRMLIGLDTRSCTVQQIDQYQQRLKVLIDLKPDEADEGRGDAKSLTSPSNTMYTPESALVGIAKPKAELLHMLSTNSAKQLVRIVCVVGRRGVGKSALTRAIFDHLSAGNGYECFAWVVASDCTDTSALLSKLNNSIRLAASSSSSSETTVTKILASKRFLLVIDDIKEAYLWHDMKELFLENRESSAIIVTTNVKSVATSCRGQLYVVSGLSDADSKKLFWEKVQVTRSLALDDALFKIFDTCEGTPLALISVANHFLHEEKAILTVKDCEEEGLALGRYLTGQCTAISYDQMRRSLSDCYSNLPDYIHRMCLLSICLFPKGHRIRAKSLARELIASGLITGGDVRLDKVNIASLCLKRLIDQNLIEPLITGIDYGVKRFQICGIMLEFVIHKAANKNFATLIHNGERVPKFTDTNLVAPVRRLSVDGDTEQIRTPVEEIGLSAVRWLRICSNRVLDLDNCKLLRVLDLEGSSGIDKGVMEKICQLQFLKYIGLRRSDVAMVSRSIKKLQLLETLDCRETLVKALPIKVLKLPELTYLFGQFELPQS